MKIRLWGFVEQTFLYKTHYHICLNNTAISRNANRLFLFYQKKSNFKLFLICILTITPSFLNKIQKVFLRKWSAKKALQTLNVWRDLKKVTVTMVGFPRNHPIINSFCNILLVLFWVNTLCLLLEPRICRTWACSL